MKKAKELIELLKRDNFKNNDEIFEYAMRIEDFLCDGFAELFIEYYNLAYYLEDSLLDIVEPLEPGMENYDDFLRARDEIMQTALLMIAELENKS